MAHGPRPRSLFAAAHFARTQRRRGALPRLHHRTGLLTAAMLLLTILPAALYANGWLAVKIVLLVVYVVLGVFALRRGRTWRVRAVCYAAALLSFAQMYFIARMHHPLGRCC